MSEEAATEAYDTLILWLREHKLEWVADQIEEEAALGKLEPRRLQIPETDFFEPRRTVLASSLPSTKPPSSKTQSAEFLVRVEYSPYEKFHIALEAVRTVVIGAVKIQTQLANTLDLGGGEIHFAPGETGTIQHSYRTTDIETQRHSIDELEKSLNELTEDVYK
ncbi:hypothetical protein [Bradyrhizobium sp. HKCCYLR20261]|uniref:hypothetical protein n=1 Tax=Bradyrhizobium sp. HKCCYLR20261 TaxID=3420760 RepID=UPI003EB9D9A8